MEYDDAAFLLLDEGGCGLQGKCTVGASCEEYERVLAFFVRTVLENNYVTGRSLHDGIDGASEFISRRERGLPALMCSMMRRLQKVRKATPYSAAIARLSLLQDQIPFPGSTRRIVDPG